MEEQPYVVGYSCGHCGLEKIEKWLNYYQCAKCRHLFLEGWKAGVLFLLDEQEGERAYMTLLSEEKYGKKTQEEIARVLKCPRDEGKLKAVEITDICPICGRKFTPVKMEVFFEKRPPEGPSPETDE